MEEEETSFTNFKKFIRDDGSKNFSISNIDIFIVNNKQPSIIRHDKQMQKSFKILI